MQYPIKILSMAAAIVLAAGQAIAGQFVLELGAPLEEPSSSVQASHGVSVDETLSAGADSYAVFSADDGETLTRFLSDTGIKAEKISEVLFVNSPAVSGGEPAGVEPREGHQVFVIQRPIPGVGFFGLEKKRKISANSNAAIAKLRGLIEWDHSYLTSDGTYCVYRADSPETIREHAALAGAPIGKITPVVQRVN